MEYGIALIDKAGDICGSFYKLHQTAGFSQATISEIRKGKRELPMEWVPILAEICGIDPTQAVADALCDRLPEGSKAKAILGGGPSRWRGGDVAYFHRSRARAALEQLRQKRRKP